jgi:hypothetical protein
MESFKQKLFALPAFATSFIRKIRAGMLLFVFDRDERKLCGVFEATSDGALNILPNAFRSSRKATPAQVSMLLVLVCFQSTLLRLCSILGSYSLPHDYLHINHFSNFVVLFCCSFFS